MAAIYSRLKIGVACFSLIKIEFCINFTFSKASLIVCLAFIPFVLLYGQDIIYYRYVLKE